MITDEIYDTPVDKKQKKVSARSKKEKKLVGDIQGSSQ
jgi:hypothetical protein